MERVYFSGLRGAVQISEIDLVDNFISSLLHSRGGNIMLERTARKPHFNRMLLLLIAGLIIAGLPGMGEGGAVPSRAADNTTKSPAFEVVSVRPNKSGQGFGMNFTPNGFIATNMPLQPVIVMAYNLRDPKLRLGEKRFRARPNG